MIQRCILSIALYFGCLVHRRKREQEGERRRGFTHLLLATFFEPLQKQAHAQPPPSHTRTHTHSGSNNATHSTIVHCQSWSPAPEPCRGLRVLLQKLHSRPPITMRMDGNPPSLNTHTYTHQGGWPLWQIIKPGAGLKLSAAENEVSCFNISF